MTWPIDVASELKESQMNDDLETNLDYTSLLQAHRVYKAIILQTNVLPAFLNLMAPSLEKSRRDRVDKDENIISLILHIFRNLAAVKDKRESNSISAEDIEASTLQVR